MQSLRPDPAGRAPSALPNSQCGNFPGRVEGFNPHLMSSTLLVVLEGQMYNPTDCKSVTKY